MSTATSDKPRQWPPRLRKGEDPNSPIPTPFYVLVDTAEQLPYSFQGVRSNPSEGSRLIDVQTIRHGLARLGGGDYSVAGLEHLVVVERKSKSDLYGSVARRANFEQRLHGMSTRELAAVVVEAEYSDCILNPPPHSSLSPRSLARTLLAWSQRFPRVHWWFIPGRPAAEGFTYRYLERAWLDQWPGEWADVETWLEAHPEEPPPSPAAPAESGGGPPDAS